jgi:hypothetical protein
MSRFRLRTPRRAQTRLSCALMLGTVAAAGAAMPAAAQESAVPDPMTTNIPYTAWAGTQVRMVKCSPEFDGLRVEDLSVTVESWSGLADYRPQVIEPSVDFIRSRSRDERCARFNVVSLGDGLARIKLKAFTPRPERLEVLEHQFLGIWMQFGVPSIDEVGANDPTAGPPGSETEVGDPAGDGSFLPSSNNGRVQVKVTGSFPHPLGPGGRFTLPADWAMLAGALATSADPSDDSPAWRWDIHDDTLKTEGHVAGFCRPAVPVAIDAVDNCRGGEERFSRVFGDFGREGGPFDPVRLPSLLSDGKLDAGDAPMPAARVDISIAPNTNPLTDIGGAGALEKADKTEVYSRDGNGTPSDHNLYAPYYEQYIPATAAEEDLDPASSGTDWFEQNNFGHDFFGLYDNWDTFPLRTVLATDTGCNRTVGFDGGEDEPRQTPAGDQTVIVATDEHGEAQVEYEPYAGGFYYDAVEGDVRNANRGCDLQDVEVLGRSVISAIARYPGQPVDFPAQRSGTLTKVVGNEFDKSLRWYPKGEGDANSNANIVVAHAQDVDGSPFAGERVCFIVDDAADSRGQLFSGVIPTAGGPFRVDTAWTATPARLDHNVLCGRLDGNGNAAIEVFNSDDETINVIGYYIDEGLLRDIDVIFGAGDPADPGDPPSTEPPPNTDGGTGTPGNGPGTDPPSQNQVVQTAGPNASQLVAGTKDANATKTTRLSKSRIIRVGSRRYLQVKVISSSGKVKLAIRLKLRSGKVIKATRRVKANRTVRVMRLSASVKSVKVSLK